MSTRASHGKIQPQSGDLLGSMFAKGDLKRQEDGQPIVPGALPPGKEEMTIPIWDELEKIYEGCLQGLTIYSEITKNRDQLKDLFAAMTREERALYIAKATQFANDLGAYDQDLDTIHNLHAGKKGGEPDMEHIKEWIQITEQYENFKIQAEAVLSQSYLQLVELVKTAEDRLAAQNTQADEGNPDIITDVVSVDVVKETDAS
jgi:hypothetical protein